MNIVIKNNKRYNFEGLWRNSEYVIEYDANKKAIPFPEKHKKWISQEQFIEKLNETEKSLTKNKNFFKYKEKKNCLICDKKNISSGIFKIKDILWEDGLNHYISEHNYKPNDIFIDAIYKYKDVINKKKIKFNSRIYTVEEKQYVKLDRNQIMILDALMEHGGYEKKYIDRKKGIYRYSEHAGLIDFDNQGVERIVISGRSNRVDRDDEEIYLPKNMPDAIDYEYIFHTHPPTPIPGGRAEIGILYEIPSISDLFHFIDHFNKGITQGSLVIAPEGMYNIRKFTFDKIKININEDKMYNDMRKVQTKIQDEAIKKFGINFTTEDFYAKISQDLTFINDINNVLNKYSLHIEYYPRIKDTNNKWIIDTIYLPVFLIEPDK